MSDQLFYVGVVIACLALSFLMSGMEAGVFALSRLRIRQWMRAGKQRAEILHGYLENPEPFLWTILVGNTVANFISLSVVGMALLSTFNGRPWLFIPVWLLVVFLFYTLGDLLPKTLFRLYPNRLCLLMVPPFRLVHTLLWPVVSMTAWISHHVLAWTGGKKFTGKLFGNREELRLVMQESAQQFSSDERVMINRVLDLQSLTVGQVMIPWARVHAVEAHTPMGEVLKLCRERGLTRVPIWEQDGLRRRVIGMLSLKKLLYSADFDPQREVRGYLKPALYLDNDLRLEVALQRLQRSGHRLAIVLGRDGSELGVISLQDILKTIFGEVNL